MTPEAFLALAKDREITSEIRRVPQSGNDEIKPDSLPPPAF
jgi:hypothetical protein